MSHCHAIVKGLRTTRSAAGPTEFGQPSARSRIDARRLTRREHRRPDRIAALARKRVESGVARAASQRRSRTLMVSPPQRRCPLARRIIARSQALLGEQFSAPEPSFGHASPTLLVLGLASGFRHQLAFGGMLQKLFRRVERDHALVLFLTPRSPLLEYTRSRREQ